MNKIEQMKLAAAKNDRERRFTPGSVEIRMDGEGDEAKPRIVGYGIVFGKRSVNLGGFTEIIQDGAADDVLLDPDTRGLFNHDRNLVLGRNGKTMTLRIDSTGVEYDIDPPDTQTGRDVTELIRRGDVDQSSFGFSVAEGGDSWAEDADTGAITRTITKIGRLFDMSPVTFPAYPDTLVAVRSLEEFISTTVEEEDSNSESKSKSKSGSDNTDQFRDIRNDSESDGELLVRMVAENIALAEALKQNKQALEIVERLVQ